jgi:hypothetical protein
MPSNDRRRRSRFSLFRRQDFTNGKNSIAPAVVDSFRERNIEGIHPTHKTNSTSCSVEQVRRIRVASISAPFGNGKQLEQNDQGDENHSESQVAFGLPDSDEHGKCKNTPNTKIPSKSCMEVVNDVICHAPLKKRNFDKRMGNSERKAKFRLTGSKNIKIKLKNKVKQNRAKIKHDEKKQ